MARGRRFTTAKSRRPLYLREWRKQKGLTQERLAARVGVSTAAISQLETGKQGYTQPVIEALADALGVGVASLLMRNPSDPEGIWSLAERLAKLPEPARRQAVEVLEALVRSAQDPTPRRAG